MSADITRLRELRINGIINTPIHGGTPKEGFSRYISSGRGFYIGISIAIFAFFIFWAVFSWIHEKNIMLVAGTALSYGMSIGIWFMALYYAHPIFLMVFLCLKNRQWPSRTMLSKYSKAQTYVSCVVFAAVVFYLLNSAAGIVLSLLHGQLSWSSRYIPSWWRYSIISIGMGVLLGFTLPRFLPYETKARARKKTNPTATIDHNDLPFGLWVGYSTGHLAQLWHRSGLAPEQNISLSLGDAAQNILVLGGIGSGKTTRLMQPLLAQLLEQGSGGLVFDVKGDVKNATITLAEQCDSSAFVVLIGPNHSKFNILAGLTPEMAASFLKSALILSGGVRTDGFWVDSATELCRNTLGILSFIPNNYTLQALYKYLFGDEFRDNIQEKVNVLLPSLGDEEQDLLKSYLYYHDNIFATFDEKVKTGVTATIAQVLSPFNQPALINAFCSDTDESMDMTEILNYGKIYLIDMPLARWGLGAKVAYTFIKLRFFNMMQNRIHNPEWDQGRPVFFMCDEYQELISASRDGLSDLNFWDKSRSSKTIGVISSQSVSSFYAAIGDHDLAHAVLQNFRQKFCFRTEDHATITLMNNLAGQARILRKTVSAGSSTSNSGQSYSSNESITEARETVLDAPLFRELYPDQAIGLLSINGRSMDDLFNLVPLYIN